MSALPFVLLGPVAFWILFAPTQMISWSWSGLWDIYRYGATYLLMAVAAHSIVFLVVGLPLFFWFWAKESPLWFLPISLPVGSALGALLGFPEYFSGGYLNREELMVCIGYGAATALGCWFARRKTLSRQSWKRDET